MAPVAPTRHHRPVNEEIDFQATQPSAEAGPVRPNHDPRPFDADVEEAQWRELPPAPPSASPLPPPPAPARRDRPRRRVWWLLALLVATLTAAGLQLLPSEPPPCGDRMFIPSTGDQPSCVDPALLHQAGK